MSNQLRLDLDDEDPNAWRRPKSPERLFIGILLDVSGAVQAEAEARRICKANALQGKILLKERLHVTLQHIGDYKRLKSRICYAASLVCAAISMSPFDVPFDRAESFPAPPRRDRPGQYPAVLRGGNDPLFALHRLLAGAMGKFGLSPSDTFVPHITMIYADKAIAPQAKAIAPQAIEPVSWTVRDFALIHSERGLTRYNILERWPLHG